MELKLNYENEDALIENNYAGNFPKQMPIYLFVDWETGEITAGARNYQIGGTPAREYHRISRAYHLPANVDAERLAQDIKDEYEKKLDEVRAGITIEWDGNNYVGLYTDEANEIDGEIEYDLENGVGLSEIDEERYTDYLLEKEIIDKDGN